MNTKREVKKLNNETISDIEALYNDFKSKAFDDYRFELPPLPFGDFKEIVKEELLQVIAIYEDSKPKGFLFFSSSINDALEVSIIYVVDNQDVLERKSLLIKKMLELVNEFEDWNVISYPMMGIQGDFSKQIPRHGFDTVGQSVVKFDFNSSKSLTILKNYHKPVLPEGYKVSSWDDNYLDQASEVIHEAFKDAKDALFDPRFLTVEGAKSIVENIVNGDFGLFLPNATSVLIFNNKVEGICFANITNPLVANIPLVGIKKNHKQKGFGKFLLKTSLVSIIKHLQHKVISVKEVNATVEATNSPALKMYRKLGFSEDYNYSHAFLKRKNVSNK